MSVHAVIVGGGVAGTTCAESLLAHAKLHKVRVKVTLVCPTATVCVGRAPVSSARAREVHVHSTDGAAWARTACAKYVRASAVALQAATRTLHLSNDAVLRYDALCIATGAAPVVPPALADRKEVHTIRDAASVRKLQKALASACDVLVVGNGGVALETVHAVVGARVTWAFRDDHAGAAFFDERAAAALLAAPGRVRGKEARAVAVAAAAAAAAVGADGGEVGAAHGPFWEALGPLRGALRDDDGSITQMPGCEVDALVTANGAMEATMTEGRRVRCDVVVCGTGVAPCIAWLTDSGVRLAAGRTGAVGVCVDARTLRASAEGVYAAGDCTTVRGSGKDDMGRDWFQRCLWTQASAAGAAAGRSMLADMSGTESEIGMEFELFAHATRFFGVRVVFLGRYAAQGLPDGYTMLEDGGGGSKEGFVRVVLMDGRMRGALLVGKACERAETYENIILDALHVAELGHALVDLDEDVADYFD